MGKNKENENFDVSFNHSFATPLSKKDEPDTRREVTYTLHYGKDKKEGRENKFFFLNGYDIANKKQQMRMGVSSNKDKGFSYTMKEAFNLLEGRAVYKKDIMSKEGKQYNAWISFDFKHLNEKNQPATYRRTDNYGFNVSAELKKLNLKENKYQDRHNQLVDSLRKGNLQAVTGIVEGKEKQIFIEANPQFKNFNLYEVNEKNNRLESVKPEAYKAEIQAPQNSVNETSEDDNLNAETVGAPWDENAMEAGNSVNENQATEKAESEQQQAEAQAAQEDQKEEVKETRSRRRGR
jgi:hypothetical protein